jgi:hypothetical protein
MKSTVRKIALIATLVVVGQSAWAADWGAYERRLNDYRAAQATMNAILAELPARTAAFDAGMAVRDSRAKYNAKRAFQGYLGRAMAACRNANNLHEQAYGALKMYVRAKGGFPLLRTHQLNYQTNRTGLADILRTLTTINNNARRRV